MGVPTNPGSPQSTFAQDGKLKPPEIEFIKNDPATTKHLACPNSSWLQSVSYDSKSLRLTVNTKEGATWQHAQVSGGQFTEMELAKSVGSYYTRNIKGQHAIVHIRKTPSLRDFPKLPKEPRHEKPKEFANPLTKSFTDRYSGKGRYSGPDK